MKRSREIVRTLVLSIALSFVAFLPLLHAGFFPMHDDTQVARVFEMGKSLHAGMLPVRMVEDLGYGYGYPIFTFYAPLAYYVGGILTLFSFPALMATKVMIALGIVMSALSMYLLGSAVWGKWGGLFSAVLYVYAPYHGVDVYVRGDIAEVWAYAFFPLALFGLWNIYKKPSWSSLAIGALGFAGVTLSHNLSALLFSPFLAIAVLITTVYGLIKKTKAAFYAPFLLVFGLLLSSFYILPVRFELPFTNVLSQIGASADYHKHFVCLSQLWQSPWGYGGSAPGCIDGFSFMIGKLQIISAVISFALLFIFSLKEKEKIVVGLVSMVFFFVSVFLMLPQSQVVWEHISLFAFLQYPWRFLLLSGLFTSIIGGYIATILSRIPRVGYVVVLCLTIGIVLFSGKYFVPQTYLDRNTDFYTNSYALRWVASKVSDEYMPIVFNKPYAFSEVPQIRATISQGSVKTQTSSLTRYDFFVSARTPAILHLALAFFPYWHASVDGKTVALSPTSKGMELQLPQGDHLVGVFYKETPIEVVGDSLSLASIVALILGIIYTRKKNYV